MENSLADAVVILIENRMLIMVFSLGDSFAG